VPVKQNSKKTETPSERNHETLLQTLLHELQDGVIVCTPDATITLFNQAATDLKVELAGKIVLDGLRIRSEGEDGYIMVYQSLGDEKRKAVAAISILGETSNKLVH